MVLKNHGIHEIIYYLQKTVLPVKNNLDHQTLETLRKVGKLIDNFLPSRNEHNPRVSAYALAIAKELKFSKKELAMIEVSALLHDIGKVGCDEEILSKPQVLSKAEKAQIERHSLRGYFILAAFTDIPQILDGVKNHHESWDGLGYPQGLKATKIPLISRILAVADAYTAMTSHRPYRSAYSKEEAIKELIKLAGVQFDFVIVEVFLKVVDNCFEKI